MYLARFPKIRLTNILEQAVRKVTIKEVNFNVETVFSTNADFKSDIVSQTYAKIKEEFGLEMNTDITGIFDEIETVLLGDKNIELLDLASNQIFMKMSDHFWDELLNEKAITPEIWLSFGACETDIDQYCQDLYFDLLGMIYHNKYSLNELLNHIDNIDPVEIIKISSDSQIFKQLKQGNHENINSNINNFMFRQIIVLLDTIIPKLSKYERFLMKKAHKYTKFKYMDILSIA